jgi:SNF2 family DNA or RNA helicase
LQLNLPETLAGPEQSLPPNVEVHLQPSPLGEGLLVQLRVQCDATEEAPIPGMEPDRIRISTPAGRFQLIRDLVAESKRAERIATQLELGKFEFDGPYSWLAPTTDEALGLIEFIRSLGEDAPTVCWPKSKPMQVIGEITPQRMQVRLSSTKDWFGVDGIAQMDGHDIPLIELLSALRAGREFVPVGENQYATISAQLRERLTSIFDVAHNDAGVLKVSRAATAIVENALGDDITYESDVQWTDALRRLAETRELVPTVPANLVAELRDYQVTGYQWLSRLSHWGIGGCLADDMGLGKTVQTLGVLLDRAEVGPALIIAPTSVGMNWSREAQKFAPSLNPLLYRDNDRQALVEAAGPNDLVITSFQLLQRDAKRFASRKWHTVVVDEAQFIKNFQTKTARAVRDLDADWCVALSGTPLENHLGELWSLLRAVSPGLLGTWQHFRKIFAEPIERDRDATRLKSLSRVVSPFILRRTKKEVLTELPPRTEITRMAELSTEERKKYDAARLAALTELSGGTSGENDQQKRIRVLAWITRLRQLACHPRLVDDRWTKSSAKLDLLMEIVEELRDGEHRALVFSQFVQHLTIVREALDKQGIAYQYLDGSTPMNKRQDAVDAFQAGEGELFLISLRAGGTGLNLTAADYVLHLDPWWNPAVEDQATDRAHRIGQTRAVTVFRLVARDTIEEQILELHQDKRDLVAGVLDGADKASKLSTDELVNLIQMSHVETANS